MATQAQLRQRVLNNLYSLQRPERSAVQRLNGSLNDTVESVIVDDGTPISAFDIIEFETGEQAYVLSKSTNTLTVIRGWNGTTKAAQADNSFIKINPRWSLAQVDDALDETLQDLAAQGLYILAAGTDLVLVSGQDEYEIVETDVYAQKGVLSIYYQEQSDSTLVGVPFRNRYEPGGAVFTTGSFGVTLLDWGNNASGDSLHVIYAQQLNTLADSDNEPMLEQALVLGAVYRVLAMTEGPRIHDPGRFTDRTVQPGQPLRDASYFSGQYQRLVWRYRGFLQAKEASLPGSRYRRVNRFKP